MRGQRLAWRFPTAALIGTVAYCGLLSLSYGLLRGAYLPPNWWVGHLFSRAFGAASWFVIINEVGAALAAVPVAIAVLLLGRDKRKGLGLILGVIAAGFVVCGDLLEYGMPTYRVAWIVEALRFLSISTAVLLLVAPFPGCPLTDVGAHREG